MALTDKQEIFCKEYLIDLNATQAAMRAGYSKKTAQRIGSENLSKPLIQEKLQELKSNRQDKLDIDALWVLKEAVDSYKYNKEPIHDALGNEVMRNATAASKFLDMCGKHTTIKAFESEKESDNKEQNITINLVDAKKPE